MRVVRSTACAAGSTGCPIAAASSASSASSPAGAGGGPASGACSASCGVSSRRLGGIGVPTLAGLDAAEQGAEARQRRDLGGGADVDATAVVIGVEERDRVGER